MSENHAGGRSLPLQEQETGLSKEKRLVEAEAQSRLRESGYHQLSVVSCDFHEGVLTLRGKVSSFYLKQVAQTLIRRLQRVAEVNNRLEVAAAVNCAMEDRSHAQTAQRKNAVR
jgi:osmotically-inducible protein OsmY